MKKKKIFWLLAILIVFGVALEWPDVIKWITIIISLISIILSIYTIKRILTNSKED